MRVVELDGNDAVLADDLYYCFTDHLGSVVAVTNSNGGLVGGITRYEPFGGYRGPAPTASNPSISDRGFTGQKHQNELALIDFNARWFMPEVGRFLSPDTIVPDPKDPQSLNRYAYTMNNPIRYSDPTGHYAFEENPDDPNIVYPDNYSTPVRCSGSCYPDWNDENNNSPWWTPIAALYGPAMAYGIIPELVVFLPSTTIATEAVCTDGDCGNEVKLGLDSFSEAAKFGIKTFKELGKLTKGQGLQRHHIIEKRFINVVNTEKVNEFLSVALTPEEHQAFTNAWRSLIGYNNSIGSLTTRTATQNDVWVAAQNIYAKYPQLLEAARQTIFGQ